jgi:hypothetical protein
MENRRPLSEHKLGTVTAVCARVVDYRRFALENNVVFKSFAAQRIPGITLARDDLVEAIGVRFR